MLSLHLINLKIKQYGSSNGSHLNCANPSDGFFALLGDSQNGKTNSRDPKASPSPKR